MNFSLNQTRRHSIQRRPARFNQRRGITLLFVISMVVLFLLMGTTFMIVSNDYYKASRLRSFRQTNVVDTQAVLDRAFYDLVRGPSLHDVSSPLRGHSILGDQYGYGLTGEIAETDLDGAAPLDRAIRDQQFWLISVNASPNSIRRMLDPRPTSFIDLENDTDYVDGIFGGRVVSVVSGPLSGFSSRIIYNRFLPGATAAQHRLLLTVMNDGSDLSLLGNDRIIINGRDFSGTGAGQIATGSFGSLAETISPNDPDEELSGLGNKALLPNRSGEKFNSDYSSTDVSIDQMEPSINIEEVGYLSSDRSVNEPYDAADFQNMFLAYRGVDGTGNPVLIPSFHRDSLYRHQYVTNGLSSPVDVRRYSFRPLFAGVLQSDGSYRYEDGATANEFFPTFSDNIFDASGAPQVAPANHNKTNSLDVDTDNDGVRDAVWIDIGLPAQTDSEGRQFKPLVAYQVLDMDGKLNVNAHGSYADMAFRDTTVPPFDATRSRGAGYGVAEISLSSVLTQPNYLALLNSRYADPIYSNYSGTAPVPVLPGVQPGRDPQTGSDNLGLPTFSVLPVRQKTFGYPFVTNTNIAAGLFSGGLDLFGQYSIHTFQGGATVFGDTLPEMLLAPDSSTNPLLNTIPEVTHSYLTNFSLQGTAGDTLFSADELEAVLRPYDHDSELLPRRLETFVRPAKKHQITTDSYEVAMPTATSSLVEKLNIILNGLPLGDRRNRVLDLIPRDILLGGKLDINRPLGNGDEDGDSPATDDPQELENTRQQSSQFGQPQFNLDLNLEYVNTALADYQAQTNDFENGDSGAAELLARDFYMTAMLATTSIVRGNRQLQVPDAFAAGFATVADARAAYARMLAQWAVNLVDFRDPDSIMTRFRYDSNPFDGWSVSPTEVVWGAERPELLISETFASHDRANQDLDSEPSGDFSVNRGGADLDWDSRQVPRTSAFFELYNPWSQRNLATRELPEELGAGGVQLGGVADGSPVWRLALKREKSDSGFLRAIYFTDINAATTMPGDIAGTSFYPSSTFATAAKVIPPGGHAVIGSSGNVGARGGEYITTFGRLNSQMTDAIAVGEIDQMRGIRLNYAGDTVRSFDWDSGTSSIRAVRTRTNSPTEPLRVFVIDAADRNSRGLSISDPDLGYQGGPFEDAVDGEYLLNTRDVPFDAGVVNAQDRNAIWSNGVTDNFRFVYLQRLANPSLQFNVTSNPYITIDTAGVDLFAYNGMSNNPRNTHDGATAGSMGESYEQGGSSVALLDRPNNLRSAERGEQYSARTFSDAGAYVLPGPSTTPAIARQNLFASDDGVAVTVDVPPASPAVADGHNLTYAFLNSFGEMNSSFRETATVGVSTTPMGWLTWNDRPFANAAEVANVPFQSAEMMLFCFNRGNTSGAALSDGTFGKETVGEYLASGYFGRFDINNGYGHLLRFSQDNYFTAEFEAANGRAGVSVSETPLGIRPATNRMARIFDFFDSPNLFLGSETFLPPRDAANNVIADPVRSLPRKLQFFAPFNSVPNFRYPGKVNLNTISDEDTYMSLFTGAAPGAMSDFQSQFLAERDKPRTSPGATDFPGVFTSVEGGEFFPNSPGRKGSDASIFRGTMPDSNLGMKFAATAGGVGRDLAGSAYFSNEPIQKLGAVATNRSSVFAIWITVGYFEVDEYNRLGAELGSEIGEVKRNRAFYMIDRSIPVAFEPGQNHNVDNIVLTRTIIE